MLVSPQNRNTRTISISIRAEEEWNRITNTWTYTTYIYVCVPIKGRTREYKLYLLIQNATITMAYQTKYNLKKTKWKESES